MWTVADSTSDGPREPGLVETGVVGDRLSQGVRPWLRATRRPESMAPEKNADDQRDPRPAEDTVLITTGGPIVLTAAAPNG
jgi:hypothetical protein